MMMGKLVVLPFLLKVTAVRGSAAPASATPAPVAPALAAPSPVCPVRYRGDVLAVVHRILGQIIWDNCPSHVTSAVIAYYLALGILTTCLPKNMTPKLQLGDLFQNRPEKASCRRKMLRRVFDEFQRFLELWKQSGKPVEEWDDFEVSPTTTAVLLVDIVEVWRESKANVALCASLAKGAWQYAQVPHPGTGPGTANPAVFNIYVSHSLPPQEPTMENKRLRGVAEDRERRQATEQQAADDIRIARDTPSVLVLTDIPKLTVEDIKTHIRARNKWVVVNGKPMLLGGKKAELVERLTAYERARTLDAAGAGARGGKAPGPPADGGSAIVSSEVADQLVADLVDVLCSVEDDEEEEEEGGESGDYEDGLDAVDTE